MELVCSQSSSEEEEEEEGFQLPNNFRERCRHCSCSALSRPSLPLVRAVRLCTGTPGPLGLNEEAPRGTVAGPFARHFERMPRASPSHGFLPEQAR